jgi:hypothetical protein
MEHDESRFVLERKARLQLIRRGVFHDVAEFKAAIDEWIEQRNQDPKPFTWTATAKTLLVKHRRAKTVLAKAGSKRNRDVSKAQGNSCGIDWPPRLREGFLCQLAKSERNLANGIIDLADECFTTPRLRKDVDLGERHHECGKAHEYREDFHEWGCSGSVGVHLSC